jgi:hypothetical protein
MYDHNVAVKASLKIVGLGKGWAKAALRSFLRHVKCTHIAQAIEYVMQLANSGTGQRVCKKR